MFFEVFCYLGDMLSQEGGCEHAILKRIQTGWLKFNRSVFFNTSLHLFLDLPFTPSPSTCSVSILFSQHNSSLLSTWPNHLSLFRRITSPMSSIASILLTHSLLFLSLTSTRQKIRIFWKIAITFLTLAQNPFNYSKRFNIILEINEGKLVHNYGNFNYKYMYLFKKCIF